MTISFLHCKNKEGAKAFTLLEVLASLSIVTVVILGPLTFSVNSSAYSRQAKDVMVSVYLAEEALELLHHQYDTLYIACSNDKDACDSAGVPAVPTLDGETPSSKAWRLFKARLDDSSLGSISCFDPDGCSYDFLTMMDATSQTPPEKYSPASITCPKLSLVYSRVLGFDVIPRNYYVCSSVTDVSPLVKDDITSIAQTTYSRTVFVTSVETIDEGVTPSGLSHPELYQDDLLITAAVSFRRSNGVVRTVKVSDFFHSRS